MTDKLYVTSGTAVLSDSLGDSGPYTIHGVALGAGDITTGASGVKKLWPPEELKKAAESLAGTPLVKNHTNTVEGVIGEVSKAKYKDGVGVLYEAEIDEQFEELAKKIANNRLDVSVRAYHAPVEELDEDEDSGAKIVENITFDNLSVVPTGAAPSNTAEVGEATEMSAASLRDAFDYESEMDVEETGSESIDDEDSVEDADEFSAPGAEEESLLEDVTWHEEADDIRRWTATFDVSNLSPEQAKRDVRAVLAEYHEVDKDQIGIKAISEEKADYHVHTDSDTQTANDEPDDEELADWNFHEPDWDGKTSGQWSQPDMKDFDTDDLGEIADHFLLSKSGFEDPENYTDLSAPVVEPNGELSLGGLRAAIGGHGVQAVEGISEDTQDRAVNWIIDTVEEEFDKQWDGDSDENSATPEADEESETVSLSDVRFWSDDSAHDSLTAPSAVALKSSSGGLSELTNFGDSTMSDIEEKIEEMEEPVVIEQDEISELEEKAEQYEAVDGRLEQLGNTIDELSEAKDLVEAAGRDQVEALRDAEDPKVVETEDYEELTDAVGDVKTLYADELEAHYPMDSEMLESKFTVFELQEMLEETEEAELAAGQDEPEPKGGQATEEELEETDEEIEAEETEAELREQYAEHYENLGWNSTAEKVRSGELSLEEMGVEL